MHAAIDLGGIKIEAALFDENLTPIKSHRIPTPNENYNDLLTTINDQINWLKPQADDLDLNIGFGVLGFANTIADMVLTSNLPTQGKSLEKTFPNWQDKLYQ
ncbi:MAG: ROK family protein [Alphaproteobacteria bacterium]|nr:ROK family protein [Alphaproteobacteria bacterium]